LAGAKEVNDLLSTKSWLCRDPKFWGCGCVCLLPMLPSVATSKSKFCSNNERRIGSWWQLWCKGLFLLLFFFIKERSYTHIRYHGIYNYILHIPWSSHENCEPKLIQFLAISISIF
jgi:hypothetical protein